jgi:chromosome segregation ATPase
MVGAGVLLALGCAQKREIVKIDDSGLARLDERQMEPVDDARVEEGRAHDALAKAKANEAEARSRLEVAKSDRAVSEAQLKRATAERDMLKKQFADQDSLARADTEIEAAGERIQATDVKAQYLTQMIGVAEAERKLAEARVETAAAKTEQAKLRAMKAAHAPQANEVNAGAIDRRVADAQQRENQFQREAADRRTAAVDLYNRWQQLDAKVRTLARPEGVAVPPPVGEPTR